MVLTGGDSASSFFYDAVNMQNYIYLNVRMTVKKTDFQDHADKLVQHKKIENKKHTKDSTDEPKG